MSYDLNEAETEGSVLPADIYHLSVKVKPGGGGDNGVLRYSKSLLLEMLELELTVAKGPHTGQKFWELISLHFHDSGSVDQAQAGRYQTAVRMGRARLRAIVESGRALTADDDTEEAKRSRHVGDLRELDGLVIQARVDVRSQNGFRPRNYIDYPITAGMPEWEPEQTTTELTAIADTKDEFADEIPF